MAYVPAPGYQSAFNPPIPYTTMIAGGLRPCMGVFIQATLPHDYKRFSVNFTTLEGDDSDIAFHVSARYDGRDRCVFNSRQSGQWQEEEIKKDMPFKAGKVFTMMFEITRNNYLLAANGERFYEYGHRIPLEQVRWLSVSGDIIVQHLAIIGAGTGTKGVSNIDGHCTLPFKGFINGGMIPKRSVVVKGIATGKNFVINLKAAFSNEIAFHLNPRFNKGTLVRNSFINGTWGQEDKQIAKNPLKQGDNFEISIRATEKKFEVFINGSHSFDFDYRMFNLAQVDTLEVDGEVKVFYAFF
ncbi:PREDICTED: galectin-4-like [Nanorana parkeri]|uniref:galectin-4-like n=1 Tax=Nanorana parkeri TaxID=125878 RepID=UPI0008545AD9|nr:PREDICTED: galectin-4-like [Nanorana parkeri]